MADGTGLTSRAGTVMLALLADQIGLTGALEGGLADTRAGRCAHPPGRVFCDLAVMVPMAGAVSRTSVRWAIRSRSW